MDDMTPLERALVRSIRAAREAYAAGDGDGAREIVHGEAVPMIAAYIQLRDTFEVYDVSTVPRGTEVAEA